MLKQKTNCFQGLIREVKALKKYHNPLPLFEDLNIDSLDGEYEFTTSIKTLHLVSRSIENTLKLHKGKCVLYSGFQILSHFAGYVDRYKQLASYAKDIFVIGVADTKIGHIADNVHIITKHAHIVRDNWFSIISGGNIHVSLIAEELPIPGAHNYDGFYSDSNVVAENAIRKLNESKVLSTEVEYGEQTTLF